MSFFYSLAEFVRRHTRKYQTEIDISEVSQERLTGLKLDYDVIFLD